MEFKSLRNIESSFRQIRLFGIVFLSLCAVVTVWSVWNSYRFAEKQREKIYVLDNGKSLMLALSQDLSQNRPAEAREHVRRFHELFFTLSPEKSAIEHNVKRALLLADKSVYHYYSDFAEKGYYNRVISGNINQMIEIDSVRCDFDKYPYNVRTFARQIILRESSVTERSLVTRCRTDSFQQCSVAGRCTCHAPHTAHIITCVRHRTDQGNPAFLLKWKQLVVIL